MPRPPNSPAGVRELAAQLIAAVRDSRPAERVRPTSTYRLHFSAPRDGQPGFTFEDGAEVASYLRSLGFGAIYSNPVFDSVEGTHGYDNLGQRALHPGLGRPDTFVAKLQEHGLGWILDIVPNHQSIEKGKNPLWQDILKYGRASQYAKWFDIDWQGDPNERMNGRVVMPFLGDTYDVVLAKGQLRLHMEGGELRLKYWGEDWPIDAGHQWPVGPGATAEVALRWKHAMERVPFTTEAELLGRAIADVQKACRRPIPGPGITEAQAQTRRKAGERLEACIARLRERPELDSLLATTLESYRGDTAPGKAGSRDVLKYLESWRDLDHLVRKHCSFQVAYWRDAAAIINYGRFFDISGLARVRMELPEVFAHTHALIREIASALAARQILVGVRIDHIDGLYDPEQYLDRLQTAFFVDLARLEFEQTAPGQPFTQELEDELRAQYAALGDARRPVVFTMVEKILAHDEKLPSNWRRYLNGTTGYEVMNSVNGVFVDRRRHADVVRAYAEVRGQSADIPDSALLDREREQYATATRLAKEHILTNTLGSDLKMRTRFLKEVATQDVGTAGIPTDTLEKIVREVIIAFTFYRTYINGQCSEVDFDRITRAVERARPHLASIPENRIEWVMTVLRQEIPKEYPELQADAWRDYIHRLQQITSPAQAKSIEDTLFYRYNAFVGLNEVGGEPMHFGTTAEEFHAFAASFEDGGTAAGTHDSKWSAASHARLNVIPEQIHQWRKHLTDWTARHAPLTRNGAMKLDPNDAYRIYCTVLAIWPPIAGTLETEPVESIRQRVQGIVLKSLREAKVHTDWISPNTDYEKVAQDFTTGILADPEFVKDIRTLVARNQAGEWSDLLGARVLQYMLSGTPDTYQGDEVPRHAGVDPDNRRPVPFKENARKLAKLEALEARLPRERLPRELWKKGANGMVFLFETRELNRLRNSSPTLFQSRDNYKKLEVRGARSEHAIAGWRKEGNDHALFVCSRFGRALRDDVREARRTWNPESGAPRPPARSIETNGYALKDNTVVLPPELHGQELVEVFTGRRFRGGDLDLGELLRDFPHAVLLSGGAAKRFLDAKQA